MKLKMKMKRMTATRGWERTVRIGRPLSRTVAVSAHIGPSGGVPKADLLPQFLRAPSRSLIRTPSHHQSLSPLGNTPTKIMRKL